MSESNDIFISYNWSIKNQVKQLDEKLTELGFKVWRDEKNLETNEKPLTSQLSDAIKRSKTCVCCITTEYCKSYNCNLEFKFANELAKPMIILMVDRLTPSDISDIKVSGRRYTTGIGILIKY